ncbi:hypothetical protein P3T42_002256 [Paraburkholderia sp. GAS38]|jgi:hypothetical protein
MGRNRREFLPARLARYANLVYIYGEDMLRFLSAGAVLLAVTSTAAAGQHYVEVWNPPEARIGQPAGKCKPKAAKTALLSRGMGKVATRRIADPLAKASTAKHGGGDGARKTTAPRFIDIPRILTPEGNVLQVSTGHTSVYVVR